MVGSFRRITKFDVGVKRLIIYLLGITGLVCYVSNYACSHFILYLCECYYFAWYLCFIRSIMVLITYLIMFVIDGCDYVWLQTCGNTRDS